ncbi:MAG TPA: FmdB family zinc ribbon protein [Zeimonas sp.]|nr:FmdB family zinc ribbon protein [Zeimonas sp.]
MPIYAYRCDSCGVEKDVLQKLSDAPLNICPDCGAEAFHKRLSAPAFQLKGSGWYVTDFRDGAKKDKADAGDGKAAAPAAESKKEAAAASAPAPAPAPAPAAAPTPAPGAGGKSG